MNGDMKVAPTPGQGIGATSPINQFDCSSKLDLIRHYQSLGWALFPTHSIEENHCTCGKGDDCGSPGKHPVSSWDGVSVAPHGLKDATHDLETLLYWFRDVCPWANVAMATGEPSGVDVIDIDVKKGSSGFISWDAFLREAGIEEPHTLKARTGGGGLHLFFMTTPGLRNRTGWIKSVDFRTTGGYVVLPPSDHHSGMPYSWVETSGLEGPANLPAAVSHALRTASTRSSTGERLPDSETMLKGVPEGKRDDTLFRWACRLRRQLGDRDRASIELLICAAAAACTPRFPEDEALRKVEQAFKQDHSTDIGDTTHADGIRMSDGGNGIRFAIKFGEEAIYVAGPGWYLWDGSVYQTTQEVEIESMGKKVVEDLYALAGQPNLTETERRKANSFAKQKDGPNGLKAMAIMARSDPGLLRGPSEMDHDPEQLAVANGIVNLRTGDKQDVSRSDLVTARSPYAYDPTVPTPRWSRFMKQVMGGDEEMICFLQRLAGLALLGKNYEHIMPVMIGSGRNGKNTYVETLTSILGDFALFPFPTTALTDKDINETVTGRLYGKRLAVVSESNKRAPLNSATVNSYTGDGQLAGRRLYQDGFLFKNTHLLMFISNSLPQVSDTQDGIWSRLKLVRWNYTIPEKDRVPNYHQLMLSEESGGIVAWCVKGAMDYLANGLRVPESIQAESRSYREMEDVFGAFMEEHIEAGEDHYLTRAELKMAYNVWCETNDIPPKDREGIRGLISSLCSRLKISPNVVRVPNPANQESEMRVIKGASITNKLKITENQWS